MSPAVPWYRLRRGNVKLGCGWSVYSAGIDFGAAFAVLKTSLG